VVGIATTGTSGWCGKGSACRATAAFLFQRQAEGLRQANGTSPTQTDDGVNMLFVGDCQCFSYLKVGDVRLDVFKGGYQSLSQGFFD
jgi:hypothetical protein